MLPLRPHYKIAGTMVADSDRAARNVVTGLSAKECTDIYVVFLMLPITLDEWMQSHKDHGRVCTV